MVALPPRDATLAQWAWLHGALAASLAWATRLPRWWVPILLPFAPAAVWALSLDVSPWVWLAAGLLPWLVFRGVIRDRVPLFLSDPPAVARLLELVTDQHPVSVVDLGCGTGGLLRALREARPVARLRGVENAPLTWLLAWLRLREDAVDVHYGSIWDEPLGHHDIVYAYLSPAAMPRLWEKACREMRPGSLLVSNSFEVPGVPAHRVLPLEGNGMATALHVWTIGVVDDTGPLTAQADGPLAQTSGDARDMGRAAAKPPDGQAPDSPNGARSHSRGKSRPDRT